jgi:ATP-dependent DNA helicase RecG
VSPPTGAPDGGEPEGRVLARLDEIPVSEVRKVGEKRAEALAAIDITTVLDLITHYPRRYIDRTRQADVAGMRMGEESLVMARVDAVRSRRTRQGRALVELDVDDGTGALRVTFFNQAWRAQAVARGHRGAVLRQARQLQG